MSYLVFTNIKMEIIR